MEVKVEAPIIERLGLSGHLNYALGRVYLWNPVVAGFVEEAQRVTVVLHYPWLLIPAVPVLTVVIAFNFLGDALRDAADPYEVLRHVRARGVEGL